MEPVTKGERDRWGACIHPSRSAEAVAAKRRDALFGGDLPFVPNAFHYESLRQSELWRKVAEQYQPDLEQFYRSAFREAAGAGLPGAPFHLVGLGAGGARKEGWLLESLKDRSGVRFTPVDASEPLALESARHVEGLVAAPVWPLVADVEALADLPGWLDQAGGGAIPRCFTAFGLTPNSEPGVLLSCLREFLRAGGDRLLVSANLLPDGNIESVRPEYDNRETRRWLRQVLVEWGLDDLLGEIEFASIRFAGVEALVASVHWKTDVELDWGGRPFRALRGGAVRLFFTIRYTMAGFEETLARYGLAVERSWSSDCGREGLCLVRRVQVQNIGNTNGSIHG